MEANLEANLAPAKRYQSVRQPSASTITASLRSTTVCLQGSGQQPLRAALWHERRWQRIDVFKALMGFCAPLKAASHSMAGTAGGTGRSRSPGRSLTLPRWRAWIETSRVNVGNVVMMGRVLAVLNLLRHPPGQATTGGCAREGLASGLISPWPLRGSPDRRNSPVVESAKRAFSRALAQGAAVIAAR